MKIKSKILILLTASALLGGCASMMRSMGMGPPMGSSEDVSDAQTLWSELETRNLVGSNARRSKVYPGFPPHGKFLETMHEEVTIDGHKGLAIVKRNYAGPNVSINNVSEKPSQYLEAVTVMYKREAGYDAEDQDWFWAKYKPDGSLHTMNKMNMDIKLAGRVAKGMPEGCIACHQAAPGGDFIFANDIDG